jgi:uncharacterized membrane protein
MVSPAVWRSRLVLVLSFLLEQWFVIMIGVVIALAHAFPNVVSDIPPS